MPRGTTGQVRTAGPASIPAGSFTMGTDRSELPALLERYRTSHAELFLAEIPRRAIPIDAFRLDRTEVTKEQFALFLQANPDWTRAAVRAASHNGQYLVDWRENRFTSGEGARPVAFVTCAAASAYCAWRGGRLPHETEWEYAARGGLADPEFPWGDARPDAAHANWVGTKLGRTSDVGEFPPNGYGLFDMAGNVWEFMADPWSAENERAPMPLPAAGDAAARHVIRGGSYEGAAINLRVRYRDSHPGGGAGPHVGFRCAY